MSREIIFTEKAPKPIGTYSQAVKVNNIVYLSAQAPIIPETMKVVEGGVDAQIDRAFTNLQAVAEAAGGSLADVVKITVFLTDLSNFKVVNEAMLGRFSEPYPARAAVGVIALPLGTDFAVEAIMQI